MGIINCKEIVQSIKNNVKEEVAKLEKQPSLLVIVVGDNKASEVYVRNKERVCEEVGIKSVKIQLPGSVTSEELVGHITLANKNDDITGILVQLPLPKHINEQYIMELIDPKKDVDGFHPMNFGKMMQGDLSVPIACTPAGIMRIFEHENIDLTGKTVTVVGRSNIVGKPISMLCQQKDATVKMAHSKTKYLKDETSFADIVICAVGRAEMFDSSYFGGDQVVIDVGINRNLDGKLCGDVDLEDVLDTRLNVDITPVPGGVGLLTVACLMENVVKCYKLQNGGTK